jgi:hypothetical protein
MENRSLGSWGVILDESVHEISGEVKDWEELEIAKVGDVIIHPGDVHIYAASQSPEGTNIWCVSGQDFHG